MRKVGILSFAVTLLAVLVAACSSDSVEQERKTQEAIIEVEHIEHGTSSCIEVTKNANSTPISIMATCQLAMTVIATLDFLALLNWCIIYLMIIKTDSLVR